MPVSSTAVGKVTWEDLCKTPPARGKIAAENGLVYPKVLRCASTSMRSTAERVIPAKDCACPLTSHGPGSLLVFPNKTVLVGRDEAKNHIAFADPVVSRCQLEIFSIVADEECHHRQLVFVRDRGSANGTAVNGLMIGKGPKLSRSRLLEDGDIITIGSHPHLRLGYTDLSSTQAYYTLSHLQQEEVEVRRESTSSMSVCSDMLPSSSRTDISSPIVALVTVAIPWSS